MKEYRSRSVGFWVSSSIAPASCQQAAKTSAGSPVRFRSSPSRIILGDRLDRPIDPMKQGVNLVYGDR